MNTVYEIRVKETQEMIREFHGKQLLQLCLNTWTLLKGKEVIAVERTTPESKASFFEVEELYYTIRDYAIENNHLRLMGHAQGAFDTRNGDRLRELRNWINLGKELHDMQQFMNCSRGISCVRQVASDLMRGDFEGAQAIAHTDWDKIRNYKQIAQFMKQNKIAKENW